MINADNADRTKIASEEQRNIETLEQHRNTGTRQESTLHSQ